MTKQENFKKLLKNNRENISLSFNNITIKQSISAIGGKFVAIDFYDTNRFHVSTNVKSVTRFL